MSLKAKPIKISEKQIKILRKFSKGTHTELNIKLRASIVLDANKDMNNADIAAKYEITRNTVRAWRNQWFESYTETCTIELEQSHKLKKHIKNTLSDKYRSGRKSTFTQEQVVAIISLSLQSPESVKVPLSHWTPGALARKSIELGIVDSISVRQVGRYLKKSGHKNTSV